MKHYDITKPIGLTTPCKEIESTCSKAHMYKRCGLRPKHYIIPLDSGSGRTTLVEYMTDMYKEAGVLNFPSGLDDYIEIAFDGTLQQLKQAFSAIESAAVYLYSKAQTTDYTLLYWKLIYYRLRFPEEYRKVIAATGENAGTAT